MHGALDLVGVEDWDTVENWSRAALMRYRSRRTLMEIIANQEQGEAHKFKLAAIEKTIAFPIETFLYLSDPRFLLALILLLFTALYDNWSARRQTSPSGD